MITSTTSPPRPAAEIGGCALLSDDGLPVAVQGLAGAQKERLESLAFEYASVPESYDLATSTDYVLESPCGRGVASVLVDGSYWHIAGGLLAPESVRPQMIRWLSQLAIQHSKTVAVYNVSEDDARQFHEAGFVVNKFGEEPVLDIGQADWSGRKFEWVRRQSNFCIRAGIEITEVSCKNEQQQLADTLLEILSDDFSGRTYDQPLKLLEGEFDPSCLLRRRLFIARSSASGAVVAFIACSPLDGGKSWAFETYRKRKNATRGVTAYLFRAAVDQLQKEGVRKISLCLVPGRNVSAGSIGRGDWRIEKLLSLWYRKLDFVFNAQGQDYFKSRFRPRYIDRYVCVSPRTTSLSIWSFLKTAGALKPNWRNLIQQTGRKLFCRN